MISISCSFDLVTSLYPESEIEHSVTIDNLESETVYFWKVVAIGENEINSESEVWEFYNW